MTTTNPMIAHEVLDQRLANLTLRWSAGLRDFWKRGQAPYRRRA
jgi:hypothetical protein